jgi:hypothetical protein
MESCQSCYGIKVDCQAHIHTEERCSRQTSQDLLPRKFRRWVMRRGKGMPKMIPYVKKLTKLFEIRNAPSSPTRGAVELLSQLHKTEFNPNLSTTTPSTRPNLNFCVDQQGGGTQTGPRQDTQDGFLLDQDWPVRTRIGGGGPIGRTVREDWAGWDKK